MEIFHIDESLGDNAVGTVLTIVLLWSIVECVEIEVMFLQVGVFAEYGEGLGHPVE
jgi:hypothetical protein